MKMRLVDPERAQTDKRFDIDVLAGIGNPIDPNGDGYAVNIASLMSRALMRLPTPVGAKSEATFFCDGDAIGLVMEQLGCIYDFRGIPVITIPELRP